MRKIRNICFLLIITLTSTYAQKTASEQTIYEDLSKTPFTSPVECNGEETDLRVQKSPVNILDVFSCENKTKDKLFWFNQKIADWEEINLNQNLPNYASAPGSKIQSMLDNTRGREQLLAHIFIFRDEECLNMFQCRIIHVKPNDIWNPDTDIIVYQ